MFIISRNDIIILCFSSAPGVRFVTVKPVISDEHPVPVISYLHDKTVSKWVILSEAIKT